MCPSTAVVIAIKITLNWLKINGLYNCFFVFIEPKNHVTICKIEYILNILNKMCGFLLNCYGYHY